jgi:hypothetical protein
MAATGAAAAADEAVVEDDTLAQDVTTRNVAIRASGASNTALRVPMEAIGNDSDFMVHSD